MKRRTLFVSMGFLVAFGLIALGIYGRMRESDPKEFLSSASDDVFGTIFIALGIFVLAIVGAYTVSRK